MKNKFLLKILLLLILVTPKIFADITQEQFNQYMKISRGGYILNFYENMLSLAIADKLNILYLRKDILEISKQDRFVKKYRENFMKLNINNYTKIIKFYKISLGKKSINAIKNLKNLPEMNKIRKQCNNILNEDCFKYIESNSFYHLSKRKKILLTQIAEKYDIQKIKRNLMYKSLIAMNSIYKNKYKYSDEFIKKYTTYNNSNYDEITKNITFLIYYRFTEKELETILNYALSNAGQKEYILIEEGITKYTNEFIRVMLKKFYPSKCISEFIPFPFNLHFH